MPPREASNAPTSPSPADQLKRIDIGQDGKETTEDERLRAFVLGEVEKAKKKLSPQALDRLVKAIAEVLSRRESDRAKIREAVQAKLKELSVDVEEQKTLKNIPLHMADRIRDYIPGDFRLKTKNELEEVDSLTPTELTKLKAELESHPKKLEKFIHGWARDHQWRASVRKDHPASFRILTEMFDGYCKKYDIRNPEGDISKQFKELQKVEDLKEEIDNLTAKFRKDIARAKERALRGVNQNVSDKISYTRLIDMLKSDALKLAEKLKKYKPEIEKTRDPMLLEKFNLTELALSSMNRKNSDGKDYIESDGLSAKDAWEFLQGKNDREALFWNQSTSKLVALESQLFGKNVVANLSIKKEHPWNTATVESFAEKFRNQGFREINSASFAEFIRMLGLQKRANIGELRKLLGPDLMRDFSIYWNLEETKNKTGAQKELSVSNPTLYKEVVESFKSYREAFVIDANKKYPNVERAIQTIFPRKQKECLEEIMKSKGSAFQTIVTVFAKYSGDTTWQDSRIKDLITALEKDSKRDATKAEAETHQNTWNERSRVIDCTKNIAVTVLQSAKLSPEEKELLEAKETWNDLRSDPERLQKIQSVFQKLIKKNILSEQDKQSFQSVEKLLGISERKAQLTAMSRSPKLIKQTSAIIDTARWAFKKEGNAWLKQVLTSEAARKVEDSVKSAGTRITAEETIAEKADSLSSTLAALGLGKYTFEDIQKYEWLRKEIMMRIGAHPDPSPEMLDLQNKIARLIERDLTDRQIEGAINAYHSDTAISKYQSTGVKESYSAQREDISSRIPGTLPQGNEATSYEALRASAVSVPNSSVSSLTQELDAGHPVIIGEFIVNRDESELRIVGKNFEVEIDQRYANTALALASIGDRLNFSEIVPSIKHIVEETQGNELFTQMRFGVSKRHETELIKLVASTLGAQYDSSLTEPNQLIRSVESWQSVQTGTPSLLELARRNGLTRANGTIEPTVFARAILGKQKIQESPRDTVLA